MGKGLFKQEIEGELFNLKEKAYVIGGGIAGFLTPIVGLKYLISKGNEINTPLAEAFNWGFSLVSNLGWLIVSPETAPITYTTLGGIALGTAGAQTSKQTRRAKENLDSKFNEISTFLNNPTSDNEFREKINNYRKNKEDNKFWIPKDIKKYDNKLAELTKNLKYVPIN